MNTEDVHMTVGALEGAGGARHRQLQRAVNMRIVVPELKDPIFDPHLGPQLDVDVVEPLAPLPPEGLADGVSEQQLRRVEQNRPDHGGVLAALVEGGQVEEAEPVAGVFRPHLEVVVVEGHAPVGVADGEVEGQVVVEGGGVVEVELDEGGGVYAGLELGGAKNEPEDEDHDAEGDDEGDEELEEVAEEAAEGIMPRVHRKAAVVGAVQMALSFCIRHESRAKNNRELLRTIDERCNDFIADRC